MNNFSPNMLKTYCDCPQKYWFKYVKKLILPQKTSLFEKGKKVHALANYYLRGDDISKLENALMTDERILWERLKNNEYFQKQYVESEYNLSCKIEDFWVGGRLDAIVKDDERYYILDYKTGSIPKTPEYDFQTIVYLLCASKKFGNNINFVYIDLKNERNYIIDDSRLIEYENMILQACEEMINIYPQEEVLKSNRCNCCEYKKICI